jgi:hypothetical protein
MEMQQPVSPRQGEENKPLGSSQDISGGDKAAAGGDEKQSKIVLYVQFLNLLACIGVGALTYNMQLVLQSSSVSGVTSGLESIYSSGWRILSTQFNTNLANADTNTYFVVVLWCMGMTVGFGFMWGMLDYTSRCCCPGETSCFGYCMQLLSLPMGLVAFGNAALGGLLALSVKPGDALLKTQVLASGRAFSIPYYCMIGLFLLELLVVIVYLGSMFVYRGNNKMGKYAEYAQ